jgi:hypothetical protein
VHDFFLPEFRTRLRNSLYKEPAIYIDEERNKPGVSWPEMLARQIAGSRIIVPIWCIEYFQSLWCKRECAVMLYREYQLQYRTFANPYGLIVPVRLLDGNGYPQIAKDIIQLDLDTEDYISINEGFKKLASYRRLLAPIKDFAKSVADCINSAPPWNPDWLTKQWVEEAIREFEDKLILPEEAFGLESMG